MQTSNRAHRIRSFVTLRASSNASSQTRNNWPRGWTRLLVLSQRGQILLHGTLSRRAPTRPVLLVDGRADAEVFFLVYQFLRRENTANGRKIGAYRVTVIVHLSSRPSIIHCRVLCRVCIVESYSIYFLCRATPVTIQDRTLLVGFYGKKKKPRCTLDDVQAGNLCSSLPTPFFLGMELYVNYFQL
jgi:hypothetical protein